MTGTALGHVAAGGAGAALGWLLAPYLLALARRCVHQRIASALPPSALRVLGSAVFALIAGTVGWTADLAAWIVFAAGAVTLSLTDFWTHRLPNPLVAAFSTLAVTSLAAAALVTGDPARLGRAVLAGLLLLVVLGALALAHPRGLGFGDAKLGFPIGLYLGWLGWPTVVIGVLVAFVLGAVAGLAMMVVRRSGRGTAVAFGPYLLGSVAVCLLLLPA